MTRKDFIFIADVIRNMSPQHQKAAAYIFSNRLGETNLRFNPDLFLQVARGQLPLTARKAVA